MFEGGTWSSEEREGDHVTCPTPHSSQPSVCSESRNIILWFMHHSTGQLSASYLPVAVPCPMFFNKTLLCMPSILNLKSWKYNLVQYCMYTTNLSTQNLFKLKLSRINVQMVICQAKSYLPVICHAQPQHVFTSCSSASICLHTGFLAPPPTVTSAIHLKTTLVFTPQPGIDFMTSGFLHKH